MGLVKVGEGMSENVRNWTASQRKFIEWLATPTDDRIPNRQGTLAKDLDVSEKTLWRWKKLPGFMAEVNKLVDEYLADDYSEVVASLKREARKGSFNHVKLYLEMINKYTPKQELLGKDGGPIAVTLVEVIR